MGNFIPPTILTGVTQTMKVAQEETFGPLAPLFKFKDEDQVIAMANDTIFGLAAYFYANNLSRVYKVSEALEYGIVGVNTGIISTEVAPFGGIKQSGLGREGVPSWYRGLSRNEICLHERLNYQPQFVVFKCKSILCEIINASL